MVRRRSTVRFRKGAQIKRLIRTPRPGLGAVPGAKLAHRLPALHGCARAKAAAVATADSAPLDTRPELTDNEVMSVAWQAGYPDSVLCQFLDRHLPQRSAVAEEWTRCAASAPWAPVHLPDSESRRRLGLAAEIRIGLDLGEAPAYFDLLSFLPPADCSSLLRAAGFSVAEGLADATGTADPLLSDWRRVQQPVGCDEGQRAALAACLEAAGMRNVLSSFSGRPVQVRRWFEGQTRAAHARWRSEHPGSTSDRDADLDGFVHLWEGYLAHGRRQLASAGSGRVILALELGGGYGVADLVIDRCLIEVKTALDPAANMETWLNQVLAYALLDWSDVLGVDTVAVYLGWQALLISESLTRILAAATKGSSPSLPDLRADFRNAVQADMDEAFAARMRQRYPPFLMSSPQGGQVGLDPTTGRL